MTEQLVGTAQERLEIDAEMKGCALAAHVVERAQGHAETFLVISHCIAALTKALVVEYVSDSCNDPEVV